MDAKTVKQAAEANISSVLASYAPDGKWEGDEYVFRNPSRSDAHYGSCKYNRLKNTFKDFASGDGGDVIDFVQLCLNCDLKTALTDLSGYLRIDNRDHRRLKNDSKKEDHESKIEVLAELPPYPAKEFNHFKFGEPIRVWKHLTETGELIGYICRYMTSQGKQDLPLYWGVIKKTGKKQFVFKAPSAPRPLFGLETLSRKTKSIILVEGQKCQAALAEYLPITVITWTQGTNGIKNMDWSPIKNDARKIIYWADHDDPGIKTIPEIAEIVGAGRLSVLDIPADKGKGWDCADMIDSGASKQDVVDFINKNMRPYKNSADSVVENNIVGENASSDTDNFNTPFRVIGYDSGRYYYFPDKIQQIRVYSASEHTPSNMLELAPMEFWERYFPGKNGSVNWSAVQDFLIRSQERVGIHRPDFIRGRGVWCEDCGIVINAGNYLIINGVKTDIAEHKSKYTYERSKSMNVELRDPLIGSETKELVNIVKSLSFERPESALYLLGWIVMAPVCGALKWRPHIWITAAAGTGKSWIIGNIIKPLIGEHISALGESTQAGLRQVTRNDSLPVIIDEFESNDKRGTDRIASIIELARQSSSETESSIFKGTVGHKAVSFNPRSIFCFSSIGLNIKEHADETRITVLRLKKNPNHGQFAEIEKKAYSMINSRYRDRLITRTIGLLPVIRRNMEKINEYLTPIISKRFADQYSVLYAGYYSLVSDCEITESEIREMIGEISTLDIQSENTQSDEERCLDIILESKVRMYNKDYSIAELIEGIYAYCDGIENDPFSFGIDKENQFVAVESYQVLQRSGIRVSVEKDWVSSGRYDKSVTIAANWKDIDKMFENTSFYQKYKNYLERLPGSEKTNGMRFAGVFKRGIKIPLSLS